jgi:hypothetical protein
MYIKSPERFKIWLQIISGQSRDPVAQIREVFGSRVIFLSSRFQELKKQLDNRPDVENVYTGPIGEKIYILPGINAVTSF